MGKGLHEQYSYCRNISHISAFLWGYVLIWYACGDGNKSPDSVINVKVEFGEGDDKISLDAIAERAKKYQPKPKITYKMIQEYVEKKYGFKVHTAYIAEVKRALGLSMYYDTPNAAEELKQPRKHPPKEKAEAIMEALKHFEVI